ncbi:MAG: phosphatidate cytidylyltransferase [Candidatus Omnitrophica bacterium]|nr:phosphatidate cytidylyltransferase [Candidatus Omnitrophota bacterium]MDD5042135.1 phosphatidate cytidylyltransferase [Candidatus Omnitrophota bacterium]MDD5500164.1 phosphatidate cytidylyltransferase [Candidatus Omnitrophota bacterium]
MLGKRVISSAVLISLISIVLFFDWLCGLVVTALIIAGLYEYSVMLRRKGINIYQYFGIAMGAIIPLSIMFRFEPTKSWELFFIVMALLFILVMQFKRRDSSGVIVDISTTIFGIVYVSWLFSFIIKVRYLPGGFGSLAALLLIVKMGDIGAFLVGSRWGKTPFLQHISPKKTMEGAVGGLCFSVLGALASKLFLPFSCLQLVLIALGLGVLGQLGDLSESLLKRDCQIKDSGNFFPGMGGVLDQIDSLLFTAPVFYFYLSVVMK